jgi:hypothetical protein
MSDEKEDDVPTAPLKPSGSSVPDPPRPAPKDQTWLETSEIRGGRSVDDDWRFPVAWEDEGE